MLSLFVGEAWVIAALFLEIVQAHGYLQGTLCLPSSEWQNLHCLDTTWGIPTTMFHCGVNPLCIIHPSALINNCLLGFISHHSQHFSFFHHPLWNAGICEASLGVFSPPEKWFRGTTQSLRWGGSDVATILYADWILVLYLASLDLVYKLQMLHDRRWCYWDAEDNLKQSQRVSTSKTTLSLLPK